MSQQSVKRCLKKQVESISLSLILFLALRSKRPLRGPDAVKQVVCRTGGKVADMVIELIMKKWSCPSD